MLQSSRMSLQQVLAQVDRTVSGTTVDPAVGDGLLSIVSVLSENVSLRKSLADASIDARAKGEVLDQLFGSQVDQVALGIVRDAAGLHWARTQDFVTAVEVAGVTAVAARAQSESRLGRVEEELFRFARTIESDHELGWAFGSHSETRAKRTLVQDLLGSAAAEETVLLASQAAAHPRGLRVSETLDNYGEVLAARQRRSVAEVVVARPLSTQQQERLTQALSRSYGRELVLHVTVDPDVVGGVRVQVGDEVMSGTIADRLSDVRRRLTS